MLRRLILAIAMVSVVPFTHASAAIAGHDERIAFARLCGTGCGDLYTVRPDGSDLRRLTRTGDNFAPAWSPDGRKIAISATTCVSDGHCHLSSEVTVFTIGVPGFSILAGGAARPMSPAWRR